MMDAQNFINGGWVGAVGLAKCESINPANGEVIGSYPDSTIEDARQAIACAVDAFNRPVWSHSPRLRQMVLLRWADRLESRIDELTQILTRENGKVLGQSRGEIAGAISEIRYYAGVTRFIPGRALEVEPGAYSTVLREPAGVAGIIVPWNAPAVLLVRGLCPALAAGCSTVIKAAPQASLIMYEMIRDLSLVQDLPVGVVNILFEKGSAVAHGLVASPDVAVICFTGSSAVGQQIMAAASSTMKKLSLELGGKSCAVVFPDASIPDVAVKLARASMIISGQQCTAARRVLVHASRYNEMKRALSEALNGMVVGPGVAPDSDIGPLIDEGALARVTASVARTLDECDEVILRGERLHGALSKGFFLSPTLVGHGDSSAFFCQEEIFGPLVVLEKFEDEAEAVARANHTVFGLSASVWTNDAARALRVARALRDGTVWVNDHNRLFAEAETGGYLRSGVGRLHGYDAMADFMEQKHIYINAGVL
ncbi:aldehyde dehydrogenase family protein [Castellaniella sp.]|uniref:aldehyde dehydrogenase family protein n=1 Tax=Castellaniella sp. TaxID=1955812 RepID=UPI00345CA4EF